MKNCNCKNCQGKKQNVSDIICAGFIGAVMLAGLSLGGCAGLNPNIVAGLGAIVATQAIAAEQNVRNTQAVMGD